MELANKDRAEHTCSVFNLLKAYEVVQKDFIRSASSVTIPDRKKAFLNTPIMGRVD
jgi:hypothetical protein